MRVGSVLVGSAALHGVVLALLVRWLPATELARTSPANVEITLVPSVSVVDPHPHPIDVAIVELHDEPARASQATTSPSIAARLDASDRAIAASQPEPGAASNDRNRSTGREMFRHMRGPDLRPAEDVMQHIADTGAGPHDRPYRSGRIENAPNGTTVIHDRVTNIRVERDGTAHLDDKPDITAEWRLPIHVDIVGDVRAFGRVIGEWYEDPYAGTRFGRTQDLPEHLQAVPGQCDTWGDVMCDDANAPGMEKHARETSGGGSLMVRLGGKLDITGYLMRKLHVGDAYASRKLKLLDDTRDERAARGAEYRAEQLTRSAELMRTSLQRLWAGTTDPDERRAVLFELWDDCAEGDAELGEAGQRARNQVIGWIRGHLPAAQPGAFTADEIQALNARRASTQPFEPY